MSVAEFDTVRAIHRMATRLDRGTRRAENALIITAKLWGVSKHDLLWLPGIAALGDKIELLEDLTVWVERTGA